MSDLEDKLKIYRDGFRDGFEAGLKAAKPTSPTPTYAPNSCSVCGRIFGLYNLHVCMRSDCPNGGLSDFKVF